MRPRLTFGLLAAGLSVGAARGDEHDWPSYNRDPAGWRFNAAEKSIGSENAGRLEEKWRFPARGSNFEIGVIHATPVVVGGAAYFGTASDPNFYKVGPDGKLLWSYRNPGHSKPAAPAANGKTDPNAKKLRFQSSGDGILGSALVEGDAVYFGDIGGWFYALDAATGKERWKVHARSTKFPGTHPYNMFFASPIFADGKVIVGGGTLEQVIGALPFYRKSTGRGFVIAFDAKTGKIAWKHDVGPKPAPLDPPVVIKADWGEQTFVYGPATSSIWCTPSFDPESGTVYFGTDVNTAPRRPTKEDPRLYTEDSCAIRAIDVKTGALKWNVQINPDDVWNNAMRSYDAKTGRYKDQSIGDTPKIFRITVDGSPRKVVGAGCKNGGFYVLDAADGKMISQTPIYTGKPQFPLAPAPDPRMLALPSLIGGLQTGCATDGRTIFVNGIDALQLGSAGNPIDIVNPPSGGRVTAVSVDLATERWRHERPKLASMGGTKEKPLYREVGDPVASGIAVANGVVYFTTVASGKLVAADAATGKALKEFEIGPVWSGPSVSRGRVYVGTGNTLFNDYEFEAYFPKKGTGELICYGLPESN
ncbi:MAG TPA: PQQ-binding-like beta-propeller repeat protein [Planctomycetia bacterium]|nr:PQQ-binding-like beta-propeller repeat protein [Planctomycetia bacterium]